MSGFHDYSSKTISSNGQLIECDTWSNTTLCRNYVERQFVELAFVEISSNLVEKLSKVCRKVETARKRKKLTKIVHDFSSKTLWLIFAHSILTCCKFIRTDSLNSNLYLLS